MNRVPDSDLRVPDEAMRTYIFDVCRAVGLPAPKARLLADLLTDNDLRGIFSHGTTQIATYARILRDRTLNPDPQVQLVRETPVSLLVDGDGGLGYFPAYSATLRLIEKANAGGMAVALTRNHGHFGAAGLYARLTLPHDLLCFVTSGHQLQIDPGGSLYSLAGGSPFAFSAPAGDEVSLLLDFGTMHDLYADSPHRDEIARLTPGLVLRHIGMGAVCQAWGGLLAGVPVDPTRAHRAYAGANQGALLIAFRIDLFQEAARFKAEMDEYVRRVRELKPLEGFDASYLPGGVEAVREAEHRRIGIPLGSEHRQRLEVLAQELGLEPPWAA